MVPDEEVQTGRVATTYLEPVERRQGLLDGEIPGDCSDGAVSAGGVYQLLRDAQVLVPAVSAKAISNAL